VGKLTLALNILAEMFSHLIGSDKRRNNAITPHIGHVGCSNQYLS
jgi:hypothetical protein